MRYMSSIMMEDGGEVCLTEQDLIKNRMEIFMMGNSKMG